MGGRRGEDVGRARARGSLVSFDPEWLALREPADAAARSLRLTHAVAVRLRPSGSGQIVRALDLATGTGANVRYLAPHLPAAQDWLAVDHDERLLALARTTSGRPVTGRCVDLHRDSAGPPADLFAGRDLVTTSALLDLVSEAWIESLVLRCRDAGAVVLFALTYDGEMRCSPREPDDDTIRDLVNEHQRWNKGFGPALGPAASAFTCNCLTSNGYRLERDRSPWMLAPDQPALQRRLIDGWASAAAETAPDRTRMIAAWRDRRLAHVAAGTSELIVGHEDIAGWPNM
jgi:hypothetical protein